MWLFTKHGFYSVTKSDRAKKIWQVRAREKKDLKNLKREFDFLRKKKIYSFDHSDYRYRIFLKKNETIKLMMELGGDIDYSNFKNKVGSIPDQAHKTPYYTRVWSVMNELQWANDNWWGGDYYTPRQRRILEEREKHESYIDRLEREIIQHNTDAETKAFEDMTDDELDEYYRDNFTIEVEEMFGELEGRVN